MDDETLSQLITLTAAAVFTASAWGTLLIWRARQSGWARLSTSYGVQRQPEAPARRWLSARFLPSGHRYPKMLTARLSVDGLYLVPVWFCRCGHFPLLVPWNDIEIEAVETYPADRLYDLRFAAERGVRVRVGVKIAQFIRRAADNSQYFAEPARSPVRSPADAFRSHGVAAANKVLPNSSVRQESAV